jgi:Bor protein
MKSLRVLFLVLCALMMMGCYAARIETGRPAGTKVIEKKWASCWIYGLIPPSTISAAAECPNGVARVETQLSFLNQVVSAITWGIYTPMQIVVTCAEESHSGLVTPAPEIQIGYNASPEDVRDALNKAAKKAIETGHPVYVQMKF